MTWLAAVRARAASDARTPRLADEQLGEVVKRSLNALETRLPQSAPLTLSERNPWRIAAIDPVPDRRRARSERDRTGDIFRHNWRSA